MSFYDEITKGPGVDWSQSPITSARKQTEIVEQEVGRYTTLEGLRDYVLQKAKEFETLRAQYERQISDAKFEMKRIGGNADRQVMQSMREGYKSRDREWLAWFQKERPDALIAIGDDGFIDIKETMRLLVEKEKETK